MPANRPPQREHGEQMERPKRSWRPEDILDVQLPNGQWAGFDKARTLKEVEGIMQRFDLGADEDGLVTKGAGIWKPFFDANDSAHRLLAAYLNAVSRIEPAKSLAIAQTQEEIGRVMEICVKNGILHKNEKGEYTPADEPKRKRAEHIMRAYQAACTRLKINSTIPVDASTEAEVEDDLLVNLANAKTIEEAQKIMRTSSLVKEGKAGKFYPENPDDQEAKTLIEVYRNAVRRLDPMKFLLTLAKNELEAQQVVMQDLGGIHLFTRAGRPSFELREGLTEEQAKRGREISLAYQVAISRMLLRTSGKKGRTKGRPDSSRPTTHSTVAR